MVEFSAETQDDGMVKVCIMDEEVCGYVSSMHLAEPKAQQLNRTIEARVTEAIEERLWRCDDN